MAEPYLEATLCVPVLKEEECSVDDGEGHGGQKANMEITPLLT